MITNVTTGDLATFTSGPNRGKRVLVGVEALEESQAYREQWWVVHPLELLVVTNEGGGHMVGDLCMAEGAAPDWGLQRIDPLEEEDQTEHIRELEHV